MGVGRQPFLYSQKLSHLFPCFTFYYLAQRCGMKISSLEREFTYLRLVRRRRDLSAKTGFFLVCLYATVSTLSVNNS